MKLPIIENGMNYTTDDGRTIYRIYSTGRSATTKWMVGTTVYRNLFEAYHEHDHFAVEFNPKKHYVAEP